MDTTHETYRQQHIRLNTALNELLAAYTVVLRIREQRESLGGDQLQRLLEDISVMELLEWSHQQTQVPTDEREQTP